MEQKPNIVFILADDLGIWALGAYGNHEIKTPNIDRLAQRGMLFKNFFCVSPVCSPARASILTGSIPSRHGIHDWLDEGPNGDTELEYLKGSKGYTEYLSEAGYSCGISGKWHLGCNSIPQQGFSHWNVHKRSALSYYDNEMYRNDGLVKTEGYETYTITDNALEFIDSACVSGKPFYLSLHYTAPHSPWDTDEHPDDLLDIYRDCKFETAPQEPRHPWASYLTDRCYGDRESLTGYFAAVTGMDRGIGRVLDDLERRGIADHTLVFFTSDNGFSCGHHGFWGKGNGTFPMNMYENSVKVPAIASMPGFVPENTSCDSLVSHYDIMPTFLELAGMDNYDTGTLPGKPFAELLQGKPQIERESVVIYDEYGPVRMIRTEDWKYIHRYPYGPNELYNLKDDPGEYKNLDADKNYISKKEELKASLDDWFFRYADPARDGTKEPVTGLGQRTLCGPAGKGRAAFPPRDPENFFFKKKS